MAGNHFKNKQSGTSRTTSQQGNAGTGASGAYWRPVGTGTHAQTRGYIPASQQRVGVQPAGRTLNPNPYTNGGGHKRKKWPIVLAVVLVLLIAGGVGGVFLYRSARSVMTDAKTVLNLTDDLKSQALSGGESITTDASQIVELAQGMEDEVSSPLWTIATFIPVFGSDISTARELVFVLNDLASLSLTPLAEALQANPVKSLIQDGGTIDVEGVETLCLTLSEVAPDFHEGNTRVQALGETHIAKLTEYVTKAQSMFEKLDAAVTFAEKFAPVAPQMLGAESPRYYLIVAENNAEIRTLGGFSGASGILSIVMGQISLESFESTQTLANSGGNTSQITISDEERTLFQPDADTLSYTAGDSFMVPDFTRGAELTRIIWTINHPGAQIDGVVAVDPIFLQYLLTLAGGVTASDGTAVDGTNAAKVLLSDTYWKYPTDGDMQDAVFASVADAAFKKVLGSLGSMDLKKLYKTVVGSIEEGRLLVWMANEDEESVFTEIGAGGQLPSDPRTPQTGVYVNNYSYSKLDYYLNLDVNKGEAVQNSDGTVSYSMTVNMANVMTADEAANLPAYVKAHSSKADTSSQERLRLYLYAPAGGSISDVNVSSGDALSEATHSGLQVFWREVRLDAGESLTVTYTVTVPAEGAENDLKVKVTPTAQSAREGTASQPASMNEE